MQLAGRLLMRASQAIYSSPDERWGRVVERRAQAWFADPRHETLREDYPLDANAVVFDVGGFKGDWAAAIFSRFACRVEVFEPAPEFASQLEWRFAPNPAISVHPFALGATDERSVLHVQGDISSTQFDPNESQDVAIERRDVARHVREQEGGVDLLKLNVEGDEYAILERLLDAGLMGAIRFLQVQFHEHVPRAAERYAAIEARLRETHELMWRFPFVWESWARRDIA